MEKNNRKPLSKKIRFEVLKRDKFTCQYCGAAAPDVILNIDHINPVCEGGTNDITNLVVACQNCNCGKGPRRLSDDAAIKQQRDQLIELQERREQLELMQEWRRELIDAEQVEVNFLVEQIEMLIGGYGLEDEELCTVRRVLKRFGFDNVYKAIPLSVDRYVEWSGGTPKSWSIARAINKIGGICYNKIKSGEWSE